MNMVPEPYVPPETAEDIEAEVTGSRIFAHYEKNGFFLQEGQLLRNAARLKDIPGAIIHGRYDLCCPAKAAWQLQKAWPQAEFTIIPNASHRTEPPLAQALVAATDRFAKL
jgi:proline iminopeptidase